MRNTHLGPSWGSWLMILLMLVLLPGRLCADEENSHGVQVNLDRMPFKELVQNLAQENKMKLVLLTDVNTMVEQVRIPSPTPVEKIIEGLTRSIGLDFWQEGDTYYIGKRKDIVATPAAVIDPGPSTQLRPAITDNTAIPASKPSASAVIPDEPKHSVVRKIILSYTSASELMWAFGISGSAPPDKNRKKVIESRIQTVLDPSHPNPNIVVHDTNTDADTSNSGHTSPWLTNYLGSYQNRNSATDGNQGIAPPRANPPNGRFNPAGNPSGNPANPAAPAKKLAGGPLASFIPDGITDIIGLIGLNALLVRADTDDSIDQLESLIKLLDQPVKYVLVEAMFVKMEVKDAMEIGSSWEYAGMPLSILSSNGGGPDGNFSMQYVKGSLKVALSTLITSSTARVVNAPRVIVANGSTASIQTDDEIPFITVDQSEDVFGRTLTTPQIQMQDFPQGLTVNNVLIHPDDSVTLDITPTLTAPGAGVGIPGGAGSVSGSSTFTVQTELRVKSGETMMMGGFISKNETMGGTRDPLLADIPILGPLFFRNKTSSTDNTETMIFVTPTILKEDTTDFGVMQTLPPLF